VLCDNPHMRLRPSWANPIKIGHPPSVKPLLNNRFAPITFKWGFVQSPFAQLSAAFGQWQDQLGNKFGTRNERRSFRAGLSEGLLALEPLTTPLDRYLLIQTSSTWTAIFANGLRTNDVHSPISYLPTVLECYGLEVACIPDRSDCGDRDALQIYGSVKFALYGPNETDWLNRIRSIAVTNDVRGWEFSAEGQVQPFEDVVKYQNRRIPDRFTCEMLESYCSALGIKLFDADFYGGQCLLDHTMRTAPPGPTMSLSEARSHLCL
jgi:hypothetical protein